ncbi:MAG: NADH-quinone oxidoreductase subunit L [Bdellovibrionota bacterium]
MENTIFKDVHYLWWVPVAPAVGSLILGLFGRRLEYPTKDGKKPIWGNDPAKYNYDWHDPDAHGHGAHAGGHDSHDHGAHDDHGHGHGHDDDHGHGGHGLAPGQSASGITIVNLIACGTMLFAALVSTFAFWTLLHENGHGEGNVALRDYLFDWIVAGRAKIELAFLADRLSIVMMLIVTWIGFLIHVYSTAYMGHDPSHWRFFSHLNFFCFAMLLLVMGDNLLLLFVGWEGVGLASYLLIGFWFKDVNNAKAAIKAFVVNRVGDFFFVIGMMLIFWYVGRQTGVWTLNVYELSKHAQVLTDIPLAFGATVATIATLCLFMGATGKSAQIPLYVWLPDAMAGPTPVSALIHAATMVTSGIYMIARMNVFYAYAPTTLTIIGIVATATAFMSATIAITQNDIKKVLAYSTVSQLGFMFMGLAAGAFWVAIFHVMTHAFFKACLFLGSGSVIHACGGEQDMRKMGGLKAYMPITAGTFMVSWIAIAGVFPFSGFFSKDEILHQLHGASFFGLGHVLPLPHLGSALWVIASVSAMMTAFYMTRQVYMTFFGTNRSSESVRAHLHESPAAMTIPLVVLAFLAAIGGAFGFILNEHWNWLEHWLAPVLPGTEMLLEYAKSLGHEPHSAYGASGWATLGTLAYAALSVVLAVISISFGAWIYSKHTDVAEKAAEKLPGVHKFLFNKWYVDELYNATVVRAVSLLSEGFAWFDRTVVDGLVNFCGWLLQALKSLAGAFDRGAVDQLGVGGTAWTVDRFGGLARFFQTGKIQTYLVLTFLGLVTLLVALQGGFQALFK